MGHALLTNALDVIVVPFLRTKTVSFSQSCCTVYFQVIGGSHLGHKSNPINTDTKGVIESVSSNGVSILSGSCYESQKDTFY